MSTNTICPKCGALQKGLNLDETNGLFICSNCQEELCVYQVATNEEVNGDDSDKLHK